MIRRRINENDGFSVAALERKIGKIWENSGVFLLPQRTSLHTPDGNPAPIFEILNILGVKKASRFFLFFYYLKYLKNKILNSFVLEISMVCIHGNLLQQPVKRQLGWFCGRKITRISDFLFLKMVLKLAQPNLQWRIANLRKFLGKFCKGAPMPPYSSLNSCWLVLPKSLS